MSPHLPRICAFLLLALGNAGDGPPPAADKDYPDARSIARDLGDREVEDAYLLAFRAIEDDRPRRLYVEEVLIAVKLKGGKWRIAVAFRWPREKSEAARRWDMSEVSDVPERPSKDFDHKPTRDEVERFLAHSTWEWRTPTTFRFVRGKIFYETWEKAFGYRPRHRFPETKD